MVVLYETEGIYWLVVYLTSNIIPINRVDFIVTNPQFESYPLFYVTHDQKLYILFENVLPSRIDSAQGLTTRIYLENGLASQLLVYNKIGIEKTFERPERTVPSYLLVKNEKYPTKEIEDVVKAVPKEHLLPDLIKSKFLEKYQFPLPISPLPPLANG
nr:hypothetical protein [Abalone asfa-like virus]